MSKIADARLWINQNYERIRHWMILVIGFILIVFAMVSYGNSNRLLDRVSILAQQNKALSEQNKKLNEENKLYAADTQNVVLQNRDNLNCLATVFAEYTHDFVPITIENLDKCVVKAGTSDLASPSKASSPSSPSKTPTSSSASASASGTSQGSSGSSSSNTNTDGTGGQSDNSQPLLDCKVDLLGLHFGCP